MKTIRVNPAKVKILGVHEVPFSFDETHPCFDRERLSLLDVESPAMQKLMRSISTEGMLQNPGVVAYPDPKSPGQTVLVAAWGRRRTIAAVTLGLPEIDVCVVPAKDLDFSTTIAENEAREQDGIVAKASKASRFLAARLARHPELKLAADADLSNEEEGSPVCLASEAAQQELDELRAAYVDEIAQAFDVDQATIENWLLIDGLAPTVRQMIDDGKIKATVALEIAGIENPERQERLAIKLSKEKANVTTARTIVKQEQGDKSAFVPLPKRALLDMIAYSETPEGNKSLHAHFGKEIKLSPGIVLMEIMRVIVGKTEDASVAKYLAEAREWRKARQAAKKGGAKKDVPEGESGEGPEQEGE